MPTFHLQSIRTALLRGSIAALLTALTLSPLQAQERSTDTRAPVIEIETLDESIADATQTFTAQVADDRELGSVTLHHRRAGERAFERVPMQALGASGYFGLSLPTDPEDLRAIEYYLQALDESGNRTVSGFAFDPLRRTLVARDPSLAGAPAPNEERPAAESSGGTRWWAVALGVIAVGAVASLAGGGDGGGGDGTVPLTVDLPEPDAR